jgi:predicted nucleic acid-binding protein
VILVDTSVWVDHLRSSEQRLIDVLNAGELVTHPFVIGEIALGNLPNRNTVLRLMADLPGVVVAEDAEVRTLIERQHLFGSGLGYVDCHLLAATVLTPDTSLWTRDRRLFRVAFRLGVATGDVLH